MIRDMKNCSDKRFCHVLCFGFRCRESGVDDPSDLDVFESNLKHLGPRNFGGCQFNFEDLLRQRRSKHSATAGKQEKALYALDAVYTAMNLLLHVFHILGRSLTAQLPELREARHNSQINRVFYRPWHIL
jgi:hypothetical protein